MTIFLSILIFFSAALLANLTQSTETSIRYLPTDMPHNICPHCGSEHLIKNGNIHNEKPKHACKDRGKQFVDKPQNIKVSLATKQLIDKLLLERISLRGSVRVTGVSWDWLQQYVNHKMNSVPRQIKVSAKSEGRLTLECDELWSFVGSKKNTVYIWLSIDRYTREIVGCFIGDRTRKLACQLWASLPGIYRHCAVVYTDFWQPYKKVIPASRHRAVGKEAGQTNPIERFNNTFRQRLSRLVRKSLSFAKKLDNHRGAIGYFMHDYNAQLAKV